ncbi:hypothetical protein RHSIM_Rhsim09G0059600 [Rhododendron simsii]|uniref:Ubiquitin-like protease family profile domain-containing protein n=1 Tax=Rhododendron simsii TaxID=118357 RepID=A0A834LEG7_RHOSS|nr:hypothetical protein RHSIM_Rhsim09G0059600 [Rhododendron simsii]
MMQQVFKKKKADVKFQTSYVLFVLSCFLCPTTKDVAATKFYPAVHNILQTPTYAWAEFVLDWLANEIVKYKKRSGKVVGGKKDCVGVAGCVLLLMLIYFDKQPMGMKVGSEGEPLIQSWTTKLIKEHIAKEETLDLVDPIDEQFPKASYRHPYSNEAFHDLKKYFIKQMQFIDVMDAALMGDVPETCIRSPSKRKASTKTKNRNEEDVEIHMDVEDFPSTSTVMKTNVRHGVDVEDIDGSRMSGLLFAKEMPLYSPDAVMADVVQHAQHVMTTMTEWLMKQEKAKAPIKDGVPRPTRHMFSSSFVYNLLNFNKVQDQKAIEDPVDANILGYDVAMCNLASCTLFLSVLLTDIEHWYCVVVNLVDKRIEVLDSMVLKTTDKKVATVTVVRMLFNMLRRTRTGEQLPTPWNEWRDNVGADATDLRKRLLVRLMLSPHNQLRDVVLTKFVK